MGWAEDRFIKDIGPTISREYWDDLESARPHHLSGTFHMAPGDDLAGRAERKAHEAARDWFGDRPYELGVHVHERRAISGEVLFYEVDYEAVPR